MQWVRILATIDNHHLARCAKLASLTGLTPHCYWLRAPSRSEQLSLSLTSIRDFASAKFSRTRLGAVQSLWIHLASAAPPAKKVNHEMALERFSCRQRPKSGVKPSLPQTVLE